MKNENTFEYTYSSKRQEEIENIKKKYMPAEEDKMEILRNLDKSAEKSGIIVSIILGAIGTLLFGTGMSLTLVFAESYFLLGIIIGVVGMVLMAAAYPVYKEVTKKQRKKIAPQIIALSEELLKS